MAPPNVTEGRSGGRGRKPKGRDRKPNYRERLARPGQRATIPDEVLRRLSPGLFEKRTRQRELAAPFTEGSPLSLRDVLRERKAAEQLEFGPLEAELGRAGRTEDIRSRTQTQNIGNWFAQYKADLERAKGQAVQPFAQGVTDVQARSQASQTASDESLKALTAQMQQEAASRGQTFTGAPAAEAAQAETSRRSVSDAMAALLQSQGATTGAFFGASQGVAGSAQLGELSREQARHGGAATELGSQKQELARERGAFRTDYLGKRREREQTSVLERKAFGLDVAKAEADVAADVEKDKNVDAKLRQDQREAKRRFKVEKERLGLQKAKERQRQREARARLEFDKRKEQTRGEERLTTGQGGARAETPAGRRAEKNRVAGVRKKSGEVQQQVERVKSILDEPNRPKGPRVRTGLITGQNPSKQKFDPAVVDAAAELRDPRTGHKLRPATMRKLQRLGMRIPNEWRPGRSRSRGAERTGGN